MKFPNSLHWQRNTSQRTRWDLALGSWGNYTGFKALKALSLICVSPSSVKIKIQTLATLKIFVFGGGWWCLSENHIFINHVTIYNPRFAKLCINTGEGTELWTSQKPGAFSVCVCTQLCPTLCNPMDYSSSGSSVHGSLQARILEWVAVSSSRRHSQPRDRTCIYCLLHWQTDSLPLSHLGTPIRIEVLLKCLVSGILYSLKKSWNTPETF